MWNWIQDLCGAAAILLLLYTGLMYGYVLQGIVQ